MKYENINKLLMKIWWITKRSTDVKRNKKRLIKINWFPIKTINIGKWSKKSSKE